jgi:predicted Zn finger-like uncharacterized protein
MSMVTSCPGCTTTFRITPEQLKHREGKVRCGKCSGVFDAFKTLASLPDDVLANSGAAASARTENPEQPSNPVDTGLPFVQAQGTLDIGSGVTAVAVQPSSAAAGAGSKRLIWMVVVVALLLALLLQLAFAFRASIAAAWPASRSTLERVCAKLGCDIPLPRRTEQLAIESSDLQADPKRPNTVILTATLRNRGNDVVAHPALELTLTNAQDQAIAKRIFQAADYLDEPSTAARGMGGMSEVSVRIALDTGELKPAGYRLFLFYP